MDMAHNFDLTFVQAGSNVKRGSLPVTVNYAWEYDVDAIDPDEDIETYNSTTTRMERRSIRRPD